VPREGDAKPGTSTCAELGGYCTTQQGFTQPDLGRQPAVQQDQILPWHEGRYLQPDTVRCMQQVHVGPTKGFTGVTGPKSGHKAVTGMPQVATQLVHTSAGCGAIPAMYEGKGSKQENTQQGRHVDTQGHTRAPAMVGTKDRVADSHTCRCMGRRELARHTPSNHLRPTRRLPASRLGLHGRKPPANTGDSEWHGW
jgi:hypothetical protein